MCSSDLLASGCGNKTLIRIGGGNIKSIFILLIIAVIAYYMVDPYKQLSTTWYQSMFAPWLGKASISLSTHQDLGSIVGKWFAVPALSMRIALGLIIGAVVLFIVFRSEDFRNSSDNILAGVVVGTAVLLAWYFTSSVAIVGEEGAQSLSSFYGNWDFAMDSTDGKIGRAHV